MNNELNIDIADKTTRFANHFVDIIGFYFLIFLHSFLFEFLGIFQEGSPWLGLYFFILFFSYHFIFELLFARTPGKFITGTKVIDQYGNKPNPKTLAIRNACRLIPFDAFSFLVSNMGWHDSISKTMVINK